MQFAAEYHPCCNLFLRRMNIFINCTEMSVLLTIFLNLWTVDINLHSEDLLAKSYAHVQTKDRNLCKVSISSVKYCMASWAHKTLRRRQIFGKQCTRYLRKYQTLMHVFKPCSRPLQSLKTIINNICAQGTLPTFAIQPKINYKENKCKPHAYPQTM